MDPEEKGFIGVISKGQKRLEPVIDSQTSYGVADYLSVSFKQDTVRVAGYADNSVIREYFKDKNDDAARPLRIRPTTVIQFSSMGAVLLVEILAARISKMDLRSNESIFKHVQEKLIPTLKEFIKQHEQQQEK